ncbi:MAG: hypothetical protein ABSB40_07175 [Nitrososphaeria archaeon]|jgi:hypothetical protein
MSSLRVDAVELVDTDKLLLLTRASHETNAPLYIETINYYVYLLAHEVGFNYAFRFMPKPISYDLSEDLRDLKDAQYISWGSRIEITDKGLSSTENYLQDQEVKKMFQEMKNYLKANSQYNELELFQRAYNIATKGI